MQTSTPQIDLSGLKDIHTELRPDFWPLAPGWYILILILFLVIIFGIYLIKRYHRLPLPYALRELEKIKLLPQANQLKLLSQLLKRVTMVKYERPEIAPLTEESWVEFLLSAAPKTITKEEAHNLAFAIYENKTPTKELYKNCKKWIKIVLKKH